MRLPLAADIGPALEEEPSAQRRDRVAVDAQLKTGLQGGVVVIAAAHDAGRRIEAPVARERALDAEVEAEKVACPNARPPVRR